MTCLARGTARRMFQKKCALAKKLSSNRLTGLEVPHICRFTDGAYHTERFESHSKAGA
jgi:hypothetical protein